MLTLIRMVRAHWNDLPLPFKGIVLSFLPLSALVVATLSLSCVLEMNDHAVALTDETLAVRSRIQDLLIALRTAEPSVKAYARNRLPTDIDAALRAIEPASADLENLRNRVAGRSAQAVHAARIRVLFDELGAALRNELSPSIARNTASPSRLLERIDALHNDLAVMLDLENRTIAAERQRQQRVRSVIEGLVWLNGLVGLTVGVTMTVLFTTGITKRVYQAIANVHRLRSGLPLIVPQPGVDEIARLGSAIVESGQLLREQTKRLNLALEGARVVIWELRPDTKAVHFIAGDAASYELTFGPQPESLEDWLQGLHPGDQAAALSAFDALVLQEQAVELDVRLVRPDGQVRWQAVRGNCHANPDRSAKRFLGIFFDITEAREAAERQRRAHEEARLARSRLSGVLEGVSDMIAALDLDFRFISFNSAFRQWIEGAIKTELQLGMSLVDILGHMPVECATILGLWTRALSGEELNAIEEFRDPEGGHRWYEIRFGTIVDEGGHRIGATTVIREITEQKQSTELLERLAEDLADSREQLSNQVRILQSVLSCMGDGLVVADEQGKFLVFNPEAERICGKGKTDVGVERWSAEYGVFLPDGETPFPPADLPLARAIGGEEMTGVEMVVQPAGRSEKTWISATARPVRDEENRLRGGLVVFRDVTAQKSLELQLKAAKERAEESNRMKNQFIATVSHDLRTPLNSITGFSNLLAKEMAGPLNEQQRTYVRYVRDGSRHLSILINDILDLSKVEMGQIDLNAEVFPLADIVPEVITMIQPLATLKRLSIEYAIVETAEVYADRTRIKQVLFNLLSNAVKFTPEDGRVWLTGTNERESVRLEVRDTGSGIPAGQEEHIFEPFVRLSQAQGSVREGSGLGLTISKKLIELQGGVIGAMNLPEGGSCVSFTIPMARRVVEMGGPPTSSVDLRRLETGLLSGEVDFPERSTGRQ